MKPRLSPAPSLFLLSPPLAIVSHVAHESFVIQTAAAAYGLLRGRAAQTYFLKALVASSARVLQWPVAF